MNKAINGLPLYNPGTSMGNRMIPFLVLVLVVTTATAQQLPVQSQFMFSKMLINPAVKDTAEESVIWLKHRSQWVGFEDAPLTQLAGYHHEIKHHNMVVGGYLFNDRYGPIRNIGLNGTYSYHIALNERDLKLGLGLGLGIYQFLLDGDLIRLHDPDDDIVSEGNRGNTWVPDGSFGAYLYDKKFYVSLSILHLLRNKILPFKTSDIYANLAARHHYYIMAGYRFDMGEKQALKPNILFDYTEGNIPHANIGVIWEYQGFMNFGLAYSTLDAVVLSTKFIIKDRFILAYSYDAIVSKMRSYNSGSHEVMLGYRLNAPKNLKMSVPSYAY